MKSKPRRYVLHQARGGKSDRWSVFDNKKKQEVKGKLQKDKAILLLKTMRKGE